MIQPRISDGSDLATVRPPEQPYQSTMSERGFAKLSKRISAHSGIVFSTRKRQLVETRPRKRLRALQPPDFKAYLVYLDSPAGGEVVAERIYVIATNLTSFFREAHHFSDMAQVFAATECAPQRVAG